MFHLNCHGELTALLAFLTTIPLAGPYIKMKVAAWRAAHGGK